MINHTNDRDNFISDCPKYEYIPTQIDRVRRIVAIGDLHGDYNVTIRTLLLAKVIEISGEKLNWIGGDTIVVQVGDQIDRCRPKNGSCDEDNDEDSDVLILKLFTNLNTKAKKYGGQVISLFGNHEFMNVLGQMNYVSKKGIDGFANYIDPITGQKFSNGLSGRQHAFKNEYSKFFACTRIGILTIGNNIFVHAGIIPDFIKKHNIKSIDDLHKINYLLRKWLLGEIEYSKIKSLVESDNTIFWTRQYGNPSFICHSECSELNDQVFSILKVGHMIIGHTPQGRDSDGINSVCDGKVWRIDNGMSDAFNKFDDIYIKTKKRSPNRKIQVLEILNDTEFNILIEK